MSKDPANAPGAAPLSLQQRAKNLGSEALQKASGALKETTTIATEAVRKASGGVKSAAQGAVQSAAQIAGDSISDAGTEVRAYLSNRSERAFDALRSLSESVTDTILPQSSIPSFLLPTGSSTHDFVCVMDFTEVIEGLAGGRFHRPRLEIWAGRSDIDRADLATRLRREFTRQLQDEHRNLRRAAERRAAPEIQRLEGERAETGDMIEAASLGLSTSLSLMLLVANPIFNLVLLLLAVFSGSGGLVKSLRYFQIVTKIKGSQKDLHEEQRELEQQLDHKNKDFRAAIERLDVRVHPLLESIVEHVSEIDGKGFAGGEGQKSIGSAPLVEEYLKMPAYREAVPSIYHPLIDAALD